MGVEGIGRKRRDDEDLESLLDRLLGKPSDNGLDRLVGVGREDDGHPGRGVQDRPRLGDKVGGVKGSFERNRSGRWSHIGGNGSSRVPATRCRPGRLGAAWKTRSKRPEAGACPLRRPPTLPENRSSSSLLLERFGGEGAALHIETNLAAGMPRSIAATAIGSNGRSE